MPRLELQLTPYTNFTKEQLDMRRKVEILKYQGNNSNQARLSKKEKYAQVVRSNYDPRKYSCPNDYKIPQSTSASGIIGGKQTYLLEDPNVPLYNYIVDQDAYGITNDIDNAPWKIRYDRNVQCLPGLNENTTTITTLLINKQISEKQTTFQLQTPVSAIIRGSYLPFTTSGSKVIVQFNALTVKIYYNEIQLPSPDNLIATFNNSNVNTISREITLQPSISQSATQETYDFESVFDLGFINISGLTIPTQPNFVYTFRISYNLSYTSENQELPAIMREQTLVSMYCNTDSNAGSYISSGLDKPSVNVLNTPDNSASTSPAYTFREIA